MHRLESIKILKVPNTKSVPVILLLINSTSIVGLINWYKTVIAATGYMDVVRSVLLSD